jgi:energy-coupling factor transporter ATP-binding protein EcfA2
MVDQNPYAFRGSVFSNVAFGLKARGIKGSDNSAKVEQALVEVGLAGTGRRRAQTLSGGELQRMAIARAMVCGPEVLVLDEPTAHVDSGSVRGIEKTVTALRDNKGTSIILATHDSSQAFRMADRVLHIEDGIVCETASTIRDGNMERREGRLTVRSSGTDLCAPRLELAGIELSGDYCVLTLHPDQLRVRVPRHEVETARPVPGEDVDLST